MKPSSIALAVAATLASLVVLAGINWGWRYVTAPIRGEVERREIEQGGARQFGQRTWFYDLCASIQGNEAAIDAQLALGDEANLQAVAGLQSRRAADIARYNGAAADIQRGQFQQANLPYRLQLGAYPGTPTHCEVTP